MFLTVELDKIPDMHGEIKKKTLEAESHRKELHNLQLQHSITKSELAAANRKIITLQNDLNQIHSELNNFSDDFDSRIVKVMEEKTKLVDQLNKQLEAVNMSNTYKDEKILSMKIKNDGLIALIRAMRSRLVQLSSSAGALAVLGEREMIIKTNLITEIKNKSHLLQEVVKTEFEDFASRAVANIIAENYRLKEENKNITKELEEARFEIAADDSIDLKADIMSADRKTRPRLFTQGTLMLELPQLFGKEG